MTGVQTCALPIFTTTTHKTLRAGRGGMVLSNDVDLGKKINSAAFPGLQGGPLMHAIASKAAAFGEALTPEFRHYSQAVVDNAKTLAQALVDEGHRSEEHTSELQSLKRTSNTVSSLN